ncbi:hypothetical protein McanCB56680_004958 [Microsporum canis]
MPDRAQKDISLPPSEPAHPPAGLWRRIGRLRHLRYEGRFRLFFEDPVRPPDPEEPVLEEHELEELSHQESRSSGGQGSGIESSVQPRQRHVPLLTDEEILTGSRMPFLTILGLERTHRLLSDQLADPSGNAFNVAADFAWDRQFFWAAAVSMAGRMVAVRWPFSISGEFTLLRSADD